MPDLAPMHPKTAERLAEWLTPEHLAILQALHHEEARHAVDLTAAANGRRTSSKLTALAARHLVTHGPRDPRQARLVTWLITYRGQALLNMLETTP